MNFNTRVTLCNVESDASGANALVEVGRAVYTVWFHGETQSALVAGRPTRVEAKAWSAHARRVAESRWALTDAWKSRHADLLAAHRRGEKVPGCPCCEG